MGTLIPDCLIVVVDNDDFGLKQRIPSFSHV
jgi:hypothetical protein